jgi:uncharacterized membrane protein YcaP (DUF421 family)
MITVIPLSHFLHHIPTFYFGIGEKEKVEAQLTQLKELHDTELKQEKDEVAWLKEEIEHLKCQHESEVSGMSTSFTEELSQAKEGYEQQKT